MKTRITSGLGLLLLTPIVAMGIIACGGDDDDGGSSSSSPSSSSSNATGTDKAYVATICKATVQFQKDLDAIDPNKVTDEKEAAKALTTPMKDYAKAISKANPPKDVKSYHDQVVAQINKAVSAIEKGGVDALNDLEDLPQPPQAVQDRLQKAAAENKDCQDAGFDFS